MIEYSITPTLKSLNNMKSSMCIVTCKGLFNNTNCVMGRMTWFGGFQHDKNKNKQPFLMDRFFYCPLFCFIFISLLVMALNFCGSMLLIFFQFCESTKGLTIHKKNGPNSTYTWKMKVKTFKHPSSFMAINYWILVKKVVDLEFLFLITWQF